jgi:hypothetical protein
VIGAMARLLREVRDQRRQDQTAERCTRVQHSDQEP